MTWGLRDVTVRFGDVAALQSATLDAGAGEVTGVVGGDGAGKSTLLRCLLGLQGVERGEVRRPPKERTGALPAGAGTWPDLSVDENLHFAARAYGLSRAAVRDRTADLLERTGLAPFGDRPARDLSGGMRRKLGVICSLVHRPELLVLDEPTTGVDPVSRADLWWLLALAAAEGAAVVFATTYLDEAERSGRIVVLDGGRVLATGTPDAVCAGVPGTVVARTERPAGDDAARAWRRRAAWRLWLPDVSRGEQRLDLDDAVTVLSLRAQGKGTAAPAPALGATRPGRPARAPTAGSALTEASGATKRFGSFAAVDGVDIQVHPGEVVGLLGANGAGKTTLIRMLLGLTRPSAGGVALFGEQPSRATRRRLGYVPQTLGLYRDLTPAENLRFSRAVFGPADGGRPGGGPPAGFPARPVGELPLGVQRALAFAAVLEREPELLVLDEPTSGVGPLARARLWESIGEAAAAGAGVLVTTHYMDEAAECDRLVMMASGRIVAEGPPADVVAGSRVAVVEGDDWAAAFSRLSAAGLPGALVGRSVRVAGAGVDEVRRALGDLPVDVHEAPATLEERFFELVASEAGTGRAA